MLLKYTYLKTISKRSTSCSKTSKLSTKKLVPNDRYIYHSFQINSRRTDVATDGSYNYKHVLYDSRRSRFPFYLCHRIHIIHTQVRHKHIFRYQLDV